MEEESKLKPVVLRNSLTINIIILQILGWWPPEGQGKTADFKRTLYLFYRVLMLTSTYFFNLFTETMIVFISLRSGNLAQLTDAGFLYLTHLAESTKLYCFISRNKSLIELLNSLKQSSFQPRNNQQLNNIQHHIYYSRLYYLFLLCSCLVCSTLLSAYPLMDARSTGNPMQLPMAMWYPFEVNYSPMFQCIFVYQTVAIMCNCFANVSCDTTYSSHMALVCAQLDNLNDSMENIVQYVEEQFGRCADDEGEDYENVRQLNDQLQEEVEESLVKCILHHRNIQEYVDKLGEVYTFCILGQLCLGIVVLCFSLFQLSVVRFNTYEFYGLASYLICIIIEISTYCYYSNEILVKSGQLPLSAYKSEWIRCNASYMKKLRIFMLCTQKPMKLYAGNFFVLSLQTFVNILRMSWSYFAVLHKVHEK